MQYSKLIRSALYFSSALLLFGCSKKNNDVKPPQQTPLAITSLSVTSGPFNTSVIITGTGFDAAKANDQVFFNGKAATIMAANTTQLTATVPVGAETGNVTVSVKNSAPAIGPVFTYQYTATVSTFAGGNGVGHLDGIGTTASFNLPQGIAIDALGNLYVCDAYEGLIRKIDSIGEVTTFAGNGTQGQANGYRTNVGFTDPEGIAIDKSSNIFISDALESVIRKINAAGYVSTFAGNGWGFNKDGIGSSASFSEPKGLAIDANGNIYVADFSDNLIRKITPDSIVTTLAGNGQNGVVNGTALSSSFDEPVRILCDRSNNIFVSENSGDIRKISADLEVTTFLPNPNLNSIYSSPCYPSGMAIDAHGNILQQVDVIIKSFRYPLME
ncbi:MAG TPA: IPT/TIG domain-containing protein [Mucilaginibacter sp.]|nr:IPT/TIG domain-containing protein [Mucilaginibacter sp.]